MLSETYYPVPLAQSPSPTLGSPLVLIASDELSPEKRLPIEYQHQEQTRWCWAACMQMVLQASGIDVTQCAMAAAAWNRTDCCTTPYSDDCNKALDVVQISAEWTRYDHISNYVAAEVPFTTARDGIRDQQPIEAGLMWTGVSRGHAVVIVGYSEVDGEYLIVLDPELGLRSVAYRDLVTNFGQGKWRYSWTGIRSNGAG